MTKIDQQEFLYKRVRVDGRHLWRYFVPSITRFFLNDLELYKKKHPSRMPLRRGTPKKEGEVLWSCRLNKGEIEIYKVGESKLFDAKTKAEFSKPQSFSFAAPKKKYTPPVFTLDTGGRKTESVGICLLPKEGKTVLTQRILRGDVDTYFRSYRFDSKEEAEAFAKEYLVSKLSELASDKFYQWGINEVMVRARWSFDPSEAQVIIFSNDLASRLLAQIRSQDLTAYLKCQYEQLDEKRQSELKVDIKHYQVPIVFYKRSQPVGRLPYDEKQQSDDLQEGLKSKNERIAALAHFLNFQRALKKDKKSILLPEYKEVIKRYNLLDMADDFSEVTEKKLYQSIIPDFPDAYLKKAENSWPIQWAVLNRDKKRVEALLDYGVNINAKNKAGKTAIILASEAGYWDIVSLFAKYRTTDKDDSSCYGMALLHAAKANQHNVVLALLKAKAPTYETEIFKKYVEAEAGMPMRLEIESDGNRALHWAVIHGNFDLVKLLLEHKANRMFKNKKGKTPVQLASESKRWDIVSLFVRYKTNKRDEAYYRIALLDAAKAGQKAVAIALLEAGALTTYVRTPDKNTALHWAVINEQPGLVEKLLECNADCTVQNKEGKTPVQLASEAGFWDIVSLIKKYQTKSKLKAPRTFLDKKPPLELESKPSYSSPKLLKS